MDRRLKDQVALVTGGSQGIGREVALTLAREGAAVAIIHLDEPPHPDRAAGVVAEIAAAGGRALALSADVADRRAVDAAVAEVITRYGKIDIAVTAAGVPSRTPLLDLTGETWDRVVAVNLTGTFNVIHAVAPHMAATKSGKIVTVASQQWITGRGKPAYVASKAAVVGLTKSVAIELGPLGINVNCLAPGATETEMLSTAPGIDAEYIARLPLRRLGQPRDMANAVLFLVLDQGSYFTGQVLSPNGGLTMS
jgi:NAD(P)-dependent dehydrogenase (short-subunit alcohol dehydrogenase family)